MLLTNHVTYKHSPSFQLDGINLYIEKGEVVSLIGPNGSGKSTFLRLISRLLKPDTGEIILDGNMLSLTKTKDIAKTLAMLPQMQDHQSDLT